MCLAEGSVGNQTLVVSILVDDVVGRERSDRRASRDKSMDLKKEHLNRNYKISFLPKEEGDEVLQWCVLGNV